MLVKKINLVAAKKLVKKKKIQNPHISAVVCDLYLQWRGAGGGGTT